MEIKNTTTGEIISLIYAPSGCDALPDIINQGTDVEMTGEDIQWWSEWIEAQEKLDAALEDALSDLNETKREELKEAVEDAQSGRDMEEQSKAGIRAIEEFLAARE